MIVNHEAFTTEGIKIIHEGDSNSRSKTLGQNIDEIN